LYNDEIKLLIDTKEAKADYKSSAVVEIIKSYADGIYYLYKHPEVQPALLTHFEPWFPLLWTDGVLEPLVLQGFLLVNLKHFTQY
jgi:hypothetical protein